MPPNASLGRALAEARRRIQRAGKNGLNEQNTKATLIEPVLRALGWDVEDVEEVVREYRLKRQDKPVDYGLLVLREPRLFVEAKGLGENLDDRKWANQIMGYAGVAGVPWIVLTDGARYRIYNAHASVRVEEKLFRTVNVVDDLPLVHDTLSLLSKEQLGENQIEVLWRAEFVDRYVRAALESLFTADNDMLLVNYVSSRAKNLSAEEIRASLRRCKVDLDFPVLTPEAAGVRIELPQARRPKQQAGTPTAYNVTLKDLISGGYLSPPVALTKDYCGQRLTARIEKDGTVTSNGSTFTSLSIAGSAARAKVTGKRDDGRMRATNGWTFWRYKTPQGEMVEVDAARQQFLKATGRLAAQ